MAADPDLVVIGGGTAGLAAARAAVRAKARVLLVTEGKLGGDCTFTGCVPSKTLLAAAAEGVGFAAAMRRVRATVERIASGEDDAALAREGVEVRHARARFTGPGCLDVEGTSLRPRRVVVATGAGPSVPPIPGLAELPYLTNETVFTLTSAPASLAVLGGGAIGCELAQAFAWLGVPVTLVEALDRLLPREEPEASTVVTHVLGRAGVQVRTGSTVVAAHRGGPGVHLDLADAAAVEAEQVLVAVGRCPATAGLGLAEAGVRTRRGYVTVDEHLRTSAPGVFAAGDVVGTLQFTHAADAMARVAVHNALGGRPRRRFAGRAIPWVTFTSPEVGRVGLTEAEAGAAGDGARVAFLPMAEVDRAVTAGQTDGFVKLIAGPRRLLGNTGGGQILGATVVAARGGELVHEAALAMRTRMFTGRLAQTVHAYPTWSIAMQQAAAQFFMSYQGRLARPAAPQRG